MGGEPDLLFSLVTANGDSALGSTFLAAEPDPAGLVPLLRERGTRFVPALAEARVTGLRACARPLSADGLPLLGRARAAATCSSRPATARGVCRSARRPRGSWPTWCSGARPRHRRPSILRASPSGSASGRAGARRRAPRVRGRRGLGRRRERGRRGGRRRKRTRRRRCERRGGRGRAASSRAQRAMRARSDASAASPSGAGSQIATER